MKAFVEGMLVLMAAVGFGFSLAQGHLWTALLYLAVATFFYNQLEKSIRLK